MNKKIIIAIVIVVLMLGLFINLSNKHKAVETIKIGSVLPLTGNIAFLGETGKNGLSLAESYINSNKLLHNGYQIKFIYGDGTGIPRTSINALNHLLDVEKVGIIFSIVSSVDMSFIPIQKEKRFLFVSHATHPELSNVDPLIFRHSPTVEQEAQLIKQYLGDDINSTILLYMLDDYGVVFAKISVQEEFIKPNNIISFNANEQDFRTICTRALQSKPNRIVICGNGKDLYRIVVALLQLGYDKEIITTLGFKVGGAFDQVKDSAKFTYVDFKRTNIDSKYTDVTDEYRRQHNKEMNVNEMIFFNSALLLVEAINNSTEKNNPNEIAKSLSNIGSFHGLGQDITISGTHDILPELEIFFNE